MGIFSVFSRKPPKDSGVRIDPRMNMTRQYPEDTVTPRELKRILKEADGGDVARYMELLDATAADPKAASVLRTRKLAVAGAPRRFEPGDESDRAKQIADETLDFFNRIPNVTQFLMHLLDAHYRAFATMRLEWDVQPGPLGLRQLICGYEAIESRFLRFENACEPRVMTQGDYQGVPIPPEWLFFTMNDKAGPVVRGGTGRALVKAWVYKGYFTIDMASFIETNAKPHVQVTVPGHYVEGSAELERAKDAARAMVSDFIGLVPEGVNIQLIESVKQTSTVRDTYLAAIRYLDEVISIAELGGDLASGSSQSGGIGHGAEAEQQGDVRQDIKEFDALSVADFLQHCVITPRTLRQYGENAPIPKLVIDVLEAEDETEVATAQKLRAETLEILQRIGKEISSKQVDEEFDLRPPDGKEDVLVAKAKPVAPSLPKDSGASSQG